MTIPGDTNVIGVGDSELPNYLTPPLSTAGAEEAPVYEQATDLFMERIRHPSAKPRIVRIPALFIARGSTRKN